MRHGPIQCEIVQRLSLQVFVLHFPSRRADTEILRLQEHFSWQHCNGFLAPTIRLQRFAKVRANCRRLQQVLGVRYAAERGLNNHRRHTRDSGRKR